LQFLKREQCIYQNNATPLLQTIKVGAKKAFKRGSHGEDVTETSPKKCNLRILYNCYLRNHIAGRGRVPFYASPPIPYRSIFIADYKNYFLHMSSK
jgi:hypothetical protein